MNKNILIGFGAFIAVVVAGFILIGNSKPKINTKVTSGSYKEFNISGKEYGFTPSTITVKKGDNVKINFTNSGTTAHNLSIPDLNVSTKTIQPGQNDSVIFNASTSGNFSFYCTIDGHKGLGMQGNLEVK